LLGEYELNPTKTILVGPVYNFPHLSANVHLTAEAYITLGEYYAKAFYQHIVRGVQWNPLRPVSGSLSGSVVTLTYNVPVPPLVFDTTNVAQLADGNYGFESFAGNGAVITNVAIVDETNGVVQLTFDKAPVGGVSGGQPIRYAYSGTATGPVDGCRGCLRDSDATVGRDGNTLYNWAVHFTKPYNFTA
jgi:hypothetical protein